MKIKTEVLLQDLAAMTEQHLQQAIQFKQLTVQELNWKENPERWSVLECLEHLNLYGDFYLPVIAQAIQNSRFTKPDDEFRSGWLGNYFANSMLPKEKLNKMKTFRDKNPAGSKLDLNTLERFMIQQEKILELLQEARKVNLNKTKSPISISTWIRLRLGDTFRFVIYHNERHMLQAVKVLNNRYKI